MIKGCVEYNPVVAGAALYCYAAQCVVPLVASLRAQFVERAAVLFAVEVLAGVLYAYVRYAYADLHLFVLFRGEGEDGAYVVSCHLSGVEAVYLIFVAVRFPLMAYAFQPVEPLPVADLGRFAQPHYEVDRHYRLRLVVTEASHDAEPLYLAL